jgi:hypothetical protein
MGWCERNRIGYIFSLAGNPVLLRQVGPLAEDAALGRLAGEAGKVRRYGDFRYAAKSWNVERRVEAGPQGADSRFIVTNLPGLPKTLYDKVYCPRGQAENLIKAHKLHLASDRTSCRKATANQFRLLIHTAAYWLMLSLRSLAPRNSFWHEAQFDTIRLCLGPGKKATAIRVACIQAAATLIAARDAGKGLVNVEECAKQAVKLYREVMKAS